MSRIRLNLNEDKTTIYWITFVIIFYLFVAYKSVGFNNYDEHFQIIEFAQYKLGNIARENLAWEYDAQIRPALQPSICFIIFGTLNRFGIQDPYILSFILRAITAIAFVLSMLYFIKSNIEKIERRFYTFFFILSFFLWFIPYINVRFSSEGWSGIFVLLSLGILSDHETVVKRKKIILLGFLFGIAVLFRYQTAVMVAGALLWMVFVKRCNFNIISLFIFSVLAILLLGVGLDYWLYNEYCLTLYNYFYVNLVKDVSSQFGTSPWYEIIRYITFSPGPLGILLIGLLIFFIIKMPKDILVWTILPFLIIHSIIPHKEVRFIFPVANLAPIVVIRSIQMLKKLPISKVKKLVAIGILITINISGLYYIALNGAGNSLISVTEFIHKKAKGGKKINLIYVAGLNPYSEWNKPKDSFYSIDCIEKQEIYSVWEDYAIIPKKERVNLLILSPEEITGPKTLELLDHLQFRKVYQNIDALSLLIGNVYDSSKSENLRILYEYSK